jgi:uncharacterized protein
MVGGAEVPAEVAGERDARGAGREHAFFFVHEGRRLFATLHEPLAPVGPSPSGWVCCAPFGEERGFAQRTAVLWARALCQEGHWVLRFDARGYGDSQGSFAEFTLDDQVADALAAGRELTARAGVACPGFWGLRLGGAVAVLAARRSARAHPLLLWEPVVNGDRYMDDLLRGVMVKEMANTGKAPRTRADLKQHLAGGGEVAVEGHVLRDATYRSIAAVDLAEAPGPVPGPCLIVQVSPQAQPAPRRELEALRRALGGAGGPAVALVAEPPPWRQNPEYRARPPSLFEASLAWVRGLGPAPAAAPGPLARPLVQPVEREYLVPGEGAVRAVQFDGPEGTLRAILQVPEAGMRARPTYLLVAPGFNCRTARYRLYVRVAQALAARGFPSLRFDPHGIGDSDGTLDHDRVYGLYRAIEAGLFVPDTRAAIDYLARQHGVEQVVLLGLCGGAATSVRAAALDPRVVGVMASELPFRMSPQPGSADADDDGRPLPRAEAEHFLRSYQAKIFSAEAWRRFLSFKSDYRTLLRSLRVAVGKRLAGQGPVAYDDTWFKERLGPRANLGLLADFQACLRREVALLCIFGSTFNAWYFAEIRSGLFAGAPGGGRRFRLHGIPDADPGYSLPDHTRQFLEEVGRWSTSEEGPCARARPED